MYCMSNHLALGTVQFGMPCGIANWAGEFSRDEAAALLDHARAKGLDTLETAVAYGESDADQDYIAERLRALPS